MIIDVDDNKSTIKEIPGDEQQYWPEIYSLFTFKIPNAERAYAVQLKQLAIALIGMSIYTKDQLEIEAKSLIQKNRWHKELWDWYINKLHITQVDNEQTIRQKLSLLMDQKGKDTTISLIDSSYQFPTGLLPRLWEFANSKKIQMSCSDMRNYTYQTIASRIPFAGKSSVKLRPYQEAAVTLAINNKLYNEDWHRGIFQIPTGGGKTEIAIALMELHSNCAPDKVTLFLVNRKELLYQTYSRVQQALPNLNVALIGDNEQTITKSPAAARIVVASVQSLWSKIKGINPNDVWWLTYLRSNVSQLIIDEAHGIAAGENITNTMVKVAEYFQNAGIRWGLTATPMMRDELSNALLVGVTGEVIFKMTNTELIKQGYLTPPKVILTKINHQSSYEDPINKQELSRPPGSRWKELYDFAIVRNPIRNKAIAKILDTIPTPAIVLVQRLDHIHYISHHASMNIQFLRGTSTAEEREEAKRKLRSGEIKILGVTTIFDEGVDIPEIRAIVLAGGGKSNIKTLQRLGRGLRLASGKDEVLIYDFIDFNMDSPGWVPMKHSRERMKLYKSEGFEIDVR